MGEAILNVGIYYSDSLEFPFPSLLSVAYFVFTAIGYLVVNHTSSSGKGGS